MWIDSLIVSSESHVGISGESVTVSEGIKEDTLLLDSKFNNVNLTQSEQHNQEEEKEEKVKVGHTQVVEEGAEESLSFSKKEE